MASHQDLRLKIISLNVRGLRNSKKRKTLFHQFKKGRYDIICLQESHLTLKDHEIIKREWGSHFHLSEGSNNSKGLLTLFNKSIDSKDTYIIFNSDRNLLSSVIIENSSFIVEMKKTSYFRPKTT